MYILYVSSYKKKAFYLSLILAFWILMIFISSLFINESLALNVTINDYLSFSCPLTYKVKNIYVNNNFDEKAIFTNAAFNNPAPTKFSNYKSIDGKLSFEYPSSFSMSQKDFSDSDIVYHIDFQSQEEKVHGFIQVWKMPYELEDFLEKSKAQSLQSYKYFEMKKINVNNLDGFLWDYAVLGGNGNYFKGMEAFLKKGDNMYRVSYFMPEEFWGKKHSDAFWGMVNSLKVS